MTTTMRVPKKTEALVRGELKAELKACRAKLAENEAGYRDAVAQGLGGWTYYARRVIELARRERKLLAEMAAWDCPAD